MNCSQKLISLIFGTTLTVGAVARGRLWIALKSWYLWYSEQLLRVEQSRTESCELLSKVDIFDIRNNKDSSKTYGLMLWIALKSWYLWYSEQPHSFSGKCFRVVNCSQKLISLIFGTTRNPKHIRHNPLWIALKSWYLWYSEQLRNLKNNFIYCCELLSKVDIFDIRNNF